MHAKVVAATAAAVVAATAAAVEGTTVEDTVVVVVAPSNKHTTWLDTQTFKVKRSDAMEFCSKSILF